MQRRGQISKGDEEYLRQYFGGEIHGGLCPADLVLALLRGNRIKAAEAIAGVRVAQMPPDPRLNPRPYPRPRREERVSVVRRNTRLPTTGSFYRFRLFKVGMTKKQLAARGVTSRDIREAVAIGYVEFA